MAKLGTPENPEIIEPGQAPRAAGLSRLRSLLTTARWLILLTIPALVADATCAWLIRTGWHEGNPFAWLLLFFVAPAAALATLVALIAVPILSISLLFIASGRPVQFRTMRFP